MTCVWGKQTLQQPRDANHHRFNWGRKSPAEQAQSTIPQPAMFTIWAPSQEMVCAIDHTSIPLITFDNFAEPFADLIQQRQWWPTETKALLTHSGRWGERKREKRERQASITITPAIEQIKQISSNRHFARPYRQPYARINDADEWFDQWLKTEVEKQLTVRLSQNDKAGTWLKISLDNS